MPDLPAAAAALSGLKDTLSPRGMYTVVLSAFLANLTADAKEFLAGGNQRDAVEKAQQDVRDAYEATAIAAIALLAGDDEAFFYAEVAAEMGFVESFFGDLAEQRAAGDLAVPGDRIEMFGRSLGGLFSELSLRAQRDTPGTWQLGAAEKHCVGHGSCTWLAGQRHPLSWFVENGFIPRKPGAAQVCGGWHCQCTITSDSGGELIV